MISLATGQSLAARIAEIADRQRIEQTYAQGATQIYGLALQANCSREQAAVLNFFIPEEMRIVNRVLAKIRLGQFRAYSKTTDTIRQQAHTTYTEYQQFDTSSAGAFRGTSTAAGGEQGAKLSFTAASGGSTSETAIGYAWITAKISGDTSASQNPTGGGVIMNHTHTLNADEHTHTEGRHEHTHNVRASHAHTLSLSDHEHALASPSHWHAFTLPAHDHGMEIPEHSHAVTPGIYKFGNPQSFTVFVDGARRIAVAGQTAELDLTALLSANGDKIERGKWITVGILPDDLAYASIVLMVQGFIQSRGTYNA